MDAQKIDNPPKWIPVKEALPEVLVSVLLIDVNGHYSLGWRTTGDTQWFWGHDAPRSPVTHWMLLPEMPATTR